MEMPNGHHSWDDISDILAAFSPAGTGLVTKRRAGKYACAAVRTDQHLAHGRHPKLRNHGKTSAERAAITSGE